MNVYLSHSPKRWTEYSRTPKIIIPKIYLFCCYVILSTILYHKESKNVSFLSVKYKKYFKIKIYELLYRNTGAMCFV